MIMKVLIATLLVGSAVLIACGPTDAEIRDIVRSEIANIEIPAGPEGPVGPQGPKGEPGQEAVIPTSLQVEELIVGDKDVGYLRLIGGDEWHVAEIEWHDVVEGVDWITGGMAAGTYKGMAISSLDDEGIWTEFCVVDRTQFAPC